MILKQGHKYRAMPHDGKLIAYIYRGGRCYYIASPYSHEATQALKAAFPAYWTAIRDYGYAHPQLVPFINEDPMLIVSLVEVGKVRTATVRNKSLNAYHNGLIMPFTWQEVGSMDMTIQTENNNAMIISQATSLTDSTKYGGYYSFGGTNGSGVAITRQGIWTLNALVSVGLIFAANTKTQYLRLCGWQKASWTYDITIANWNIYDTAGNPFVKLVPFLTSEGEVCFLDLVNLQLHHNVYTDPFTIQVTDKAT